ncbi:RagB/SusD family nutrient uptake outer membrane protein [Sediminitomix flava]|uniref:Putative outer membrane starch-binding protein n=1 Tax=Sediminitomix flava TaxID=379075 RepID=A0A315ZIW7_SEDFL|nr:RagB/SusD family nutrient uptake outer membrane protein [Sediminitomix flava]PWJ45030.1 putative outer membrane starch-binding protein [Sediminitomix flava]
MKFIYKIALAAGLALSSFSCDDQLELAPTDFIDYGKAYQSVEDVNLGLLGVYSALPKTTQTSLNAYVADNAKMSPQGRNVGVVTYNWTYTSEDLGAWSAYYVAINRINLVLAGIESVKVNLDAESAEAEELSLYEAEAYGLRAFAHFSLFQSFSESYTDNDALAVPYMRESIISMPVRNTVSEVYELLSLDLDESAKLMDAVALSNEKSRFNRVAIDALRARISLYKEDYAAAIQYSSAALNEVSIASGQAYDDMWTDLEDDSEVIFKYDIVSTDGTRVGGLFQDAGSNDVQFYPTFDLINAYDANIFLDKTQDVRYNTVIMNDATDPVQSSIIGKFRGTTALPFLADVKVFRASEMLLIRAEAYAKSNSTSEAWDDVKELLTARITGYAGEDTGRSILDEIALQRRLELAYEGHRFYDLRRTGEAIIRTDVTLPGTTPTQLAAGDHRFVLPIPQSELFANDNMVQNPGYVQ